MNFDAIIGGFQKQSFIDWEGRTVAVIFTRGCNFRCGFCHNPSLVLPNLFDELPEIPFSYIVEYLNSRMGWLDGVVFIGGEPTIHQQLPEFIGQIKDIGFEVKLDTNGTNPLMVANLIGNKLIDYVAMDIKTELDEMEYQKVVRSQLPNVVGLVGQTLNILQTSEIPYQLRTTVVPKYHTPAVIEKLQQQFNKQNYVLQEFRDGNTLDKCEL